MTKKKKLNEAPLNVWGEHLNEDENNDISERILELDSKGELNKDEAKELNLLLAMEKGLLAKSKEKVEEMKTITAMYHKCLDKITDDERLSTLFNVRIFEAMDKKGGEIATPEEMEDIFKKMMEEDMDVVGHDKLKEEFEEIVKTTGEHNNSNKCGEENCIYCSDIQNEEAKYAFERLDGEGYFNPAVSDEQKLINLMVTIMRLENLAEGLNDIINDFEDDKD